MTPIKLKCMTPIRLTCQFCGFSFTVKKLPARAPQHWTHQASPCGAGGILITKGKSKGAA